MTTPAIEAAAPDTIYRTSYLAALAASRAAGYEGFTLWHSGLAETDFLAFLRRLQRDEEGVDLPDGFVPASHLWLVTPERGVVGIVNVRHRLGPGNERVGGHIGYFVPHAFRGKGYGHLCLAHGLARARTLGIARVLITCSPENTASRRIITRHGGVFESEVIDPQAGRKLRFWITLQPPVPSAP
ncbi:putative acetyltransferase [Opitutaceae bacterium TAV1]|nr:putative acetyltransferase [Opitutaceae bacterium TAV1]